MIVHVWYCQDWGWFLARYHESVSSLFVIRLRLCVLSLLLCGWSCVFSLGCDGSWPKLIMIFSSLRFVSESQWFHTLSIMKVCLELHWLQYWHQKLWALRSMSLDNHSLSPLPLISIAYKLASSLPTYITMTLICLVSLNVFVALSVTFVLLMFSGVIICKSLCY